MQMEDHVGDILTKARASARVTVAEAAAAAGLAPDQYLAFESSGQSVTPPDWKALGTRLGLHPGRLEAVARGWMPAPRDLSLWRELRMITTHKGLPVNCYLVWDEVTREAALFDTGWEAEPIVALVRENDLQLRHIFVTHAHTDHVAALGALREQFTKVRIHSGSASAPVEQRNRPNDFIHLGSLRITNRATPGHAEDGTTYVVGTWPEDAPHVAFVGDALFAGSMGKAGGALELARAKVREQVFTLPPETLVCPGHGPVTTVGEEKANNPFFGGEKL